MRYGIYHGYNTSIGSEDSGWIAPRLPIGPDSIVSEINCDGLSENEVVYIPKETMNETIQGETKGHPNLLPNCGRQHPRYGIHMQLAGITLPQSKACLCVVGIGRDGGVLREEVLCRVCEPEAWSQQTGRDRPNQKHPEGINGYTNVRRDWYGRSKVSCDGPGSRGNRVFLKGF